MNSPHQIKPFEEKKDEPFWWPKSTSTIFSPFTLESDNLYLSPLSS
jgi:hypothetical protein